MTRNILVRAPAPFNSINIVCDCLEGVCDLEAALAGRLPESLLDSCHVEYQTNFLNEVSEDGDIHLRLTPRTLGGKGGFGSQLRAAGGRMKGNKKANTEAMKDVSGRRLRTLKKAQELAEALRDAPEREREEHKQKRDKLLAILNTELPGRSGRQIVFEDEEYIAQSENILEDIRHALEQAYEDEESELSTDEELEVGQERSMASASKPGHEVRKTVPRQIHGWDDDDDDDNLTGDSSDEEGVQAQDIVSGSSASTGKGKAKEVSTIADNPVAKRRKLVK